MVMIDNRKFLLEKFKWVFSLGKLKLNIIWYNSIISKVCYYN